MTKDATGWAPSWGAWSAMLAARGYTALAPEFLLRRPLELGTRWHLRDVYVKPYPCCRWTQPAIDAALQVRRGGLEPRRVRRIVIHTFQAADGLSWRRPATTEDMQYSLVWPVAVALASGAFGVDEVLADVSPRRQAWSSTPRSWSTRS